MHLRDLGFHQARKLVEQERVYKLLFGVGATNSYKGLFV
jgi:hypothetical protein